MTTTTKLGLKKPAGTDNVSIADLNYNMDILDNVQMSEEGKGLSTNDYDNTDKEKLDLLVDIQEIGENLTLEDGVLSADAQEITVDSELSISSANPVENRAITRKLNTDDVRLHNIEEAMKGSLVSYVEDDDEAYSKVVPAPVSPAVALLPNNQIKMFGGKSVVLNQLVQNGNFASMSGWTTIRGAISVSNNVLTYTISEVGTYSNHNRMQRTDIVLPLNHKFLCRGDFLTTNGEPAIISPGSDATIGNRINTVAGVWTKYAQITTKTIENAGVGVAVDCRNSAVGDMWSVRNVMIIDLTQMFGAGSEPTAVEEVEAIIGTDYIPYNEGEIVNAVVDSVDSYDANSTLIQSKTIPQSVKNLPLYGASAGNVYNEVDWVNKKYIQRVGSVDLGTLDWNNPGGYFSSTTSLPNVKTPAGVFERINAICSKYTPTQYSGRSDKDLTIIFSGSAFEGQVWIIDSDYTDPAAFKNAMSGVMLYYELAEPIITDISDILTDDEWIELEAGGTITFTQTGLHLPIPNIEGLAYKLGGVS